MYDPAEKALGHYLKLDGTIEFYGRIRAILRYDFIVADVGAGRAAWFRDDKSKFRKAVRHLRDEVAQLVGCDVDPVVLENPSTHENRLIENGRLPFEDSSVDVIIADYVLEHVGDPDAFYAEVVRVLKPGGYFCARTPHMLNYVALAARMIANRSHATVLQSTQPGRQAIDVFPTVYKLNTLWAIRRRWTDDEWDNFSYLYTAEPSYYWGRKVVYRVLSAVHKLMPLVTTGNLFVFLRRRPSPGQAPGR